MVEGKQREEKATRGRGLVVVAPTGLGVALGVIQRERLKRQGTECDLMIGSTWAYGGRSTHANVFYQETLPKMDLSTYSGLYLVAIPLDFRNPQASQKSLDEAQAKMKDGVIQRVEIRPENENEERLVRLGKICQRDESVLPITNEERLVAEGIDAALMPREGDEFPKNGSDSDKQEWDERMKQRQLVVAEKLVSGDWGYFVQEAERFQKMEIPKAGVWGRVAVVDTENTGGVPVGKYLERVVRRLEVPNGLGMMFNLDDNRANMNPSHTVTIIRDWEKMDSPSVEDMLTEAGIEGAVGPKNLKTIKLTSREELAKLVINLLEVASGEELADLSNIRKIVICGDPNSGKSTFAYELVKTLTELGVPAKRLDLDKVSPTSDDYFRKIEELVRDLNRAEMENDQEAIVAMDYEYRKLIAGRQKGKIGDWTDELGRQAERELREEQFEGLVIADIAGGQMITDPDTGENNLERVGPRTFPIQSADGVIIVSKNSESLRVWETIISKMSEAKIIGQYKSVLGENIFNFDSDLGGEETGVVGGLRRSEVTAYNPVVLIMAMMMAKAWSKRQAGNQGH